MQRADVNLASAKATIVFDPDEVDVDQFTATIESLGYHVPEIDDADEIAERESRTLKRRLIVAAVLAVPTVLISMVPALMFDGWEWVAFALATPVVFYSGAGFHRVALVNLRHGNATMDTLVSMGTLSVPGPGRPSRSCSWTASTSTSRRPPSSSRSSSWASGSSYGRVAAPGTRCGH